MDTSFVKRLLPILAMSLVAFIALVTWQKKPTPAPQLEHVPPRADLIRAGAADEPVREVTPDHRVARIAHKDANGLLPLEYVETPNGRVTVQRTFSLKGKLIKQEAFLAGKPVPIPVR